MQRITKKKGSFKNLLFKADISATGKTINDISDVFFVVKEKLSDTDINALILKDKSDGIQETEGDSPTLIDIQVPWAFNEYTNFIIGRVYFGGLFIQFTGDPVADEDVEELFEIVIEDDLLKDS